MGLFDRQTKALEDAVRVLEGEIAQLKVERTAQVQAKALEGEIKTLKTQIIDLEIKKGKLDEQNAREKREVMHMVGLERKRQEAEAENAKKELEAAKREAMLAVREENLQSERQAFEKSMKFQEERFKKEVGYLKDLMTQILDRLPTVNVDRRIEDKTSTKT